MSNTSTIIVTYNCGDVIYQCIESIVNSHNCEVIVIDNASTDNTLEKISSFENKIILISNTQNKGFTHACNQGIKVAKGKYIFLLNPDAWFAEACLTTLSSKLEQDASIGAIAPNLNYPDGSFQNYTRTFPSVLALWVESFIPMKWWNKFSSYKKYTCQNIDFKKEQEVEQPAGAALLFRKQWTLDENYFIYGSDVDLCKTIIKDGYKIIQTPEAIVYHHQSKGGTENKKLRIYLDLDNYYGMKYYFKKNQLVFQLAAYKALFSSSLLARAVLASISNADDQKERWTKFKGFINNKNFLAINEH